MKQSARIPWKTVCIRLFGCAMIGFGLVCFVVGSMLIQGESTVCSIGLLIGGTGALMVWSYPRITVNPPVEPADNMPDSN